MRNLLLSSFLFLLFFTGCSIKEIKNYQKTGLVHSSSELKSIFDNSQKSFLFNAEITLYNNYFSGLMVFKQMQDSTYRVVFATQFGLKIFDFELKGNDFIVKYCMEQLNRKSIINILKQDIQLLLLSDFKTNITTDYQNSQNSELRVLKIKAIKGTNYYFFNNQKDNYQIIKSGILRKKTSVNLFKTPNYFIDSIAIKHYNIKLNLNLKYLENK